MKETQDHVHKRKHKHKHKHKALDWPISQGLARQRLDWIGTPEEREEIESMSSAQARERIPFHSSDPLCTEFQGWVWIGRASAREEEEKKAAFFEGFAPFSGMDGLIDTVLQSASSAEREQLHHQGKKSRGPPPFLSGTRPAAGQARQYSTDVLRSASSAKGNTVHHQGRKPRSNPATWAVTARQAQYSSSASSAEKGK